MDNTSNINRTPKYNLRAVLKETGLSADVLRAWERRYELPQPQRTGGGHRLYSEYDLAMIKWLRARQAEGLSISRAVELWKNITKAGNDPLLSTESLTAPVKNLTSGQQTQIDFLKSRWLENCMAFDAIKAEETVNQAFALYPVETVCLEILQKGIAEVGQLWYENKASAQQEHFASALAIRRIETLISATPNPTRGQTILTGCAAGEWHTIPVLILTLLLRRLGHNVIFLGANLPLEQMEETAAATHPNLVILAAQQLRTATEVQSAATLFQKLNIPLAYGGLIFNRIPQIREAIPGFYLGDSLDGAAARIEQLLAGSEALPHLSEINQSGKQAAEVYRTRLPMIERRLESLLSGDTISGDYTSSVNTFFAAGLSSALNLGSPVYFEHDLEWTKKLLEGRKIPPGRLIPYLKAYQQAVDLELGEAGKIISDWIASYIAKE